MLGTIGTKYEKNHRMLDNESLEGRVTKTSYKAGMKLGRW